ncbi:Fur family transcriptional regulator [Sulfurospirillum arcachonense]|uniref:Fur family transcriptional regulator n=1 Tax=Sulfurospirillum arcachonense TaxID=57666 RepID=UPI0004B41903|nr:transcriptional repressor [Sulfurospirillum arcachonense]
MEKYQKLLKNNNLKSTHQRLSILHNIDKAGHIDIDLLYSQLTKNFTTLSKATLYRNINDLIASNIIEEIKLPELKHQYEIKKESHVHLLCKKCNYVQDYNINLDNVYNDISVENNFQIEKSFVVLRGICSNCS